MHPSALRRTADWTLANGSKIPKIGLGTWKAPKGQVGAAVSHALKTGYRHLDLAWAYRNEDEVGDAIRKSNVSRKDLWLTSKLWNSFHAPDNVEKGLDATLQDLGVDYLDLYLIHWPVAFLNEGGEQVASHKGEDGKPLEQVELSRNIQPTWEVMEQMLKKGKVRNIGISNFNIRRSQEILKYSNIKPVVNQVEVNWGCPNESLLQWSEQNGIKLEGYSPLGSNNNVARYLGDPVIADVAARNNMTPAQVFIAWTLGRGIISLPKSVTPARIESNFEVMNLELPEADIKHLTAEALKRPLERTVDPREGWGTADDIYEDNIDHKRYQGSTSTPQGGSGQSRSYHSSAARSTNGARSSTVLQKLHSRPFASSSRARASTAEIRPPAASEAPAVASSSLLRSTTKAALATPGLTWTDKEDGVQRETRKINMYTVRHSSSMSPSLVSSSRMGSGSVRDGHCGLRSGDGAALVAAGRRYASTSAAPSVRPAKKRIYSARKALLVTQYSRLLEGSYFVMVLQHNGLSVAELAQVRRDIAAVPLPTVPGGDSLVAPPRLTVVRAGLMRPACRESKTNAVRQLSKVFGGPTALLTMPGPNDHLVPDYVSRVLAAVEKVLGHRAAKGAASLTASSAAAASSASIETNPRLTPLAALALRSRLLKLHSVRNLANSPPLDTLRAQIVGLLSAPAQNLAGVLEAARGARLVGALQGRKAQLEEVENTTPSSQ